MVKRISAVLVCLELIGVLFAATWRPIHGQGAELLQNPGFSSYYGIGGANVVPIGWLLTSSIMVSTSSHSYIYDGPVEFPGQPNNGQSWAISANSARFTAIGYQHVATVGAGTKVRFSAYGNVYTCNKDDSCIENGIPYRISDKTSGSVERVGIDPYGGTDPYAATVQWSSFVAPFDRFTYISVETVIAGANGATVFLYATQSTAMLLNDAYWYGASLQVVGSTPIPRAPTATNVPGVIPSPGPSPTAGVVPTAAPVKIQSPQADGSIVHMVMAGDTLFGIALAYKVTILQIELLNNISANSLLRIGQKLLIHPANTPIPSPTSRVPTVGPIISLQPGLDGITATPNQTLIALLSTPVAGGPSILSGTASPVRLQIVLVVIGVLALLVYLGAIFWGLVIARWRQR